MVVHASEFTNVAFALKAVVAVVVQEPQGQAGAPPPDPMKKGPRMQIYGFAMVDLIYDIDQVNPDWFDVERPTKLPSFPNEFGDNGNFWASVRQTRFGVRGWLPTGWGEVKTEFEFDLFGVGVDAGRRRSACARPGASSAPSSPARRTASSWTATSSRTRSSTGARRDGLLPQRPAALDADRGRQRSCSSLSSGRGRPPTPGQYSRPHRAPERQAALPVPGLHGALPTADDWGHVQLAGIVRYIGWTDTLPDQFDLSGHAIGWGFNLSSVIKIGKTGNIRAPATYGEGIENYMNDAPVDVGIERNPGNPLSPITGKALPDLGIVAFYDFNWNDSFTTAIGYSRLDIDNSNGQLPDAFKNGQYALRRTSSTTRSRTS